MPWLAGPGSVVLAAGIVGATVMPHALYLHGSLTRGRVRPSGPAQTAAYVRSSNLSIGAALGLAALINLAMMYMAAAAGVFLLALLASGLSISVVGDYDPAAFVNGQGRL